jgi:hypothetical protein
MLHSLIEFYCAFLGNTYVGKADEDIWSFEQYFIQLMMEHASGQVMTTCRNYAVALLQNGGLLVADWFPIGLCY